MTRIQKIREDIFQLQCLDRETSIVSVDDLEWTLRQLQLAQSLVSDLSDLARAGTTPDADGRAALHLRRIGDRDDSGGNDGSDGDGNGNGDGDSEGDTAEPDSAGQRASILRRAEAFLRDLSQELPVAAPRA